MAVRVGIGLFSGQIPEGSGRSFAQEYRETIDLVRLAEALGFDSAWVTEHHGSSDGYLPSLFPMLAAFAAATERIQLGTGVVLAPLHDPIRLAEDAAVVDQLSGGRLIMGLGLGWREEEFRMLRIPFESRVTRIVETAEVLRRAWTGERFSFRGRVFDYDRIKVTPPPAQPGGPPIFLGGYHDRAIRRAGRLGDGFITDDAAPDTLRTSLGLVEEGAREAGKDPASVDVAILQNAFVWDDADSAWRLIEAGVRQQWGAYEAWEAGDDTPDRDRLEPVVSDEAVMCAATPVGSPSEVARTLRPLAGSFGDRGVLHLVVRLHYPGMDFETASRAVELFGEQVIPVLKGT